jgi:four helix bundle protein
MLISMGSASELEYHLLLARDLGYLSAQHYQELLQEAGEVKRMLSTFITKLRHTKWLRSEGLCLKARAC